MPDTTRPPKKKPAWLTGEEAGSPEPQSSPAERRKGPLTEEDTAEIPESNNPATEEASERVVSSPRPSDGATETIPRVRTTQAPEASGGVPAGNQTRSGGNTPVEIIQRLRANPAPALLALLVLVVLLAVFWFMFLRGEGETNEAPADKGSGGGDAPLAAQPSPEAGGVDNTGIIFRSLEEDGDNAALQGAGLDWDGSVTKKDGGAGETITLDGPTAAQVERGFEVDNSYGIRL